ncbi:MAG: F0F1 ATP synthase subunit alpha [Chloroflexota bacterium]
MARPDPEEISAILKSEIEQYRAGAEVAEVGRVLQVGDGIARVHGLSRTMASELLRFPGGVHGMALNLDVDSIGCILLGPYEDIREGDEVSRTGRIADVPVGDALLGRVVNPLGEPIDGRGPITTDQRRAIEGPGPGVIDRQSIHEPLATGLKAIDALTPIGRGQRELIIGDRQTGKSAIAVDTILNQRDTGVKCIYVAIGQKVSAVAALVDQLRAAGAMTYSTVVVASAGDPAPLLYIAPYAGVAMGEHFMYNGGHALIVFDDLTRHAVAYRELSLLLRRPPGREAFPGDVFYLHARLLERAAKLSPEHGGGSLTALPIIETQAGDIHSYIPTNVISITDGQVFLEADLFFAGVRPAVNYGISVSRVGGAAQAEPMRQVAPSLRVDLARYRELASFAQFVSDLDKATRSRLERGKRIVELLKQGEHQPMPLAEQVIAIFAGVQGYLDDVPVDAVARFEKELLAYMRREHKDLLASIVPDERLSDAVIERLRAAVTAFKQVFDTQSGRDGDRPAKRHPRTEAADSSHPRH